MRPGSLEFRVDIGEFASEIRRLALELCFTLVFGELPVGHQLRLDLSRQAVPLLGRVVTDILELLGVPLPGLPSHVAELAELG